MQPFDYLKNGQTVSELRRLQEQAQQDPETVLSVCRLEVERATDARGLCDTLLQAVISARELLRQLAQELHRCGEELPSPSGFFVSLDQRRAAMERMLRLLAQTKASVEGIRMASLEISLLERSFLELTARRVCAEHRLRDTGLVAKMLEDESMLRACAKLEASLKAGERELAEIHTSWTSAQTAMLAFCDGILSNFNIRIAKATDLEHEGAACNLSALRSLCGELRYAAEGTLAQLENVDSFKHK